MIGKKPHLDFPLKGTIDGTEELYTQTSGVNNKFTVNQIKDYVLTFTSSNSYQVYSNNAALPATGQAGVFYIVEDYNSTGKSETVYWSGSEYLEIDEQKSPYVLVDDIPSLPGTGDVDKIYVIKDDGEGNAQTKIWDGVEYLDVDSDDTDDEVYEPATIAARDALTPGKVGAIAIITDANGNGDRGISFFKGGSSWSTPIIESSVTQYPGLNDVTWTEGTRTLVIDDGVNTPWTFVIADNAQDSDANPANELQTLTINPTTGAWSLSQGGGTGSLNDGVDWDNLTSILTLWNTVIDLSAFGTNTDNQQLTKEANNVLRLTSDSGNIDVDMSEYKNSYYAVATIAARDALTDVPKGSIAEIADADGLATKGLSFYNGSDWSTPFLYGGGSGGGVNDIDYNLSKAGRSEFSGVCSVQAGLTPIISFESDTAVFTSNGRIKYLSFSDSSANYTGSHLFIKVVHDIPASFNVADHTTMKLPGGLNLISRDNLSVDPPTVSSPFTRQGNIEWEVVDISLGSFKIKIPNAINNYNLWTVVLSF